MGTRETKSDAIIEPVSVPAAEEARIAYWLFCAGVESAKSFLLRFEESVAARGRGATSAADQDLLRAMVTTAGSTLDATVKRLIRDSLDALITKSPAASTKIKELISNDIIIGKGGEKRLAEALLSPSPRAVMVDYLISDLTGDSLQSISQLYKVASIFGIDQPKYKHLQPAFECRNQIIHEMDCRLEDLSDVRQGERWRRPRAKRDMMILTNDLLMVARELITGVDGALSVSNVEL